MWRYLTGDSRLFFTCFKNREKRQLLCVSVSFFLISALLLLVTSLLLNILMNLQVMEMKSELVHSSLLWSSLVDEIQSVKIADVKR